MLHTRCSTKCFKELLPACGHAFAFPIWCFTESIRGLSLPSPVHLHQLLLSATKLDRINQLICNSLAATIMSFASISMSSTN
ncbi:Os10g0183500 [Oryza sativa Japonica Group]|uniref:Os10g0183500 protein n=1 Tax=Oryza sativa subsp. japonica TaxID=39947 RepID=Q0IYP5_ORYSJ|nr:Os10g0183500 [Oryza sativa Japonica Group]|eukprot:NP_001064256.1 Os10g0183500 [Oryza sativa Japonica Group]